MQAKRSFTIHTYIHFVIGLVVAFMVLTVLLGDMWDYHVMAGYLLIALYVCRVIVTKLKGTGYTSPFTKSATGKDRFKGGLYMLFYFSLAVSLYTGFMMEHGSAEMQASVQWMHVKSLYYLVTFIVVHTGYSLIMETGVLSKLNATATRKPGYRS